MIAMIISCNGAILLFLLFFKVVQLLKEAELVQLIGLHCHIGSTIRDARLYSEVTRVLLEIRLKVSVISSFFVVDTRDVC